MKVIDNILVQLEECITMGTFKELETDKVELKDLSGGDDWKELAKSTCAFLNAQGGMVIIGVKEVNDKSGYQFHGFKAGSEDKLKELPKKFTTDAGQPIDLTDYIRPDLFEIRDFMTGRICVVYVEKLPEDKKYVLFNGTAYERKLTGDHKINKDDVAKQKELRVELETVRELRNVENATKEHYEKGKRQNRLRDGEEGEPNDIRKIVDAYKDRSEEDRYSRRVSMDEIVKNDYNLNISRYVSTATSEEIIDLQEVNEKLVDIEKKATEARDKHNEFLKELGLQGI